MFIILLTLIFTACSSDKEKVSLEKEIEENEETQDVESVAEDETKPTEDKIEETEKETEETQVETETETQTETETETEEKKPTYKQIKDTRFAKSAVNVRTGPSTSYDKIGTLKKGQKVTRIGVTDKGWDVIEYNDQEAYVSGKYLLENNPEEVVVDKEAKSTAESQAEEVATKKPDDNKTKEGGKNNYADQVLDLVNQERGNKGLSKLTKDSNLENAANKRATELVSTFSHTRPDGSSCFTVYEDFSISYGYKAENIAEGQRTPEEVVNAWINSEGHRKNILNENYSKLGVGVYEKDGIIYWTQLFGG